VLEDGDEIGGHNDSLQLSVDSCQLRCRENKGVKDEQPRCRMESNAFAAALH
jgi:hypothetical protein